MGSFAPFKIKSFLFKNIFSLKKTAIYSLGILATASLTGCGTTGKIMHPGKDNYGLIVNSSYNGNLITIDKATKCYEYNDRKFYFANSGNMDQFKKNPEKYIDMHEFNQAPERVKVPKTDYNLKTDSSYNGNPIVVSEYTPVLDFLGRLYYFAHHEETQMFSENPLIYIAKYPANKVPKTISPLKSDYGKKTICASTGTPILIGPHTPALEYIGRIYYFSSLFEMQAFQQDPQAYSAKDFNQQ